VAEVTEEIRLARLLGTRPAIFRKALSAKQRSVLIRKLGGGGLSRAAVQPDRSAWGVGIMATRHEADLRAATAAFQPPGTIASHSS
jgi:hypothetical protein